jgi:BCCT family betaine/carnitine transporter
VPSLVSVLWMTAMGGTAITQVVEQGFTGARDAALSCSSSRGCRSCR